MMTTLRDYYGSLSRRDTSIERHHFDPLSLGGHDLPHNIHGIVRKAHLEIHNNLNIPMVTYSQKTRQHRKSSNHRIISDIRSLKKKYDLQDQYYKNLHNLPDEFVDLHEWVKYRGVKHRQNIAKDILAFDEMTEQEEFFTMQEHIKQLEIQIAKEIAMTIKKKYYGG